MTNLSDSSAEDRDFENERGSEVDDFTGDSPRPSDAGAPGGPAEATLEHDIATLLAERDSFKDIALRLQADFENYRKRVAAQQADEVDRATGKFAEALLPVLDACEAAFAHGVQGIEAVWSALIGTLQKQGLEALDLAGQPFDPAVAEAVMHEPADGADSGPVVADVLRTGYRWKGRVLRPAMVKVRG
jgi:molecular chaperone GrpE